VNRSSTASRWRKLTGRVVALNYEVTGEQYAGWMADIGVPHDRLYVVNMRGRRNLLADEDGRRSLAEVIRAQDGEVLTVDPFGRAYTGKSQYDPAEVTPWLVRLNEVAEQAGIRELVMTVHAGWDGERTRGSTALEDWPDSIVTMTRDPDTGERFLRAEGRDVDLDEDRLDYDRDTRRLRLSGAGNRRQVRQTARGEHLADVVEQIVAATPGVNVTGIETALRDRGESLQKGDASKACRIAEERGTVRREQKGRSMLHFPATHSEGQLALCEPTPTNPGVPQGQVTTYPDPPYMAGYVRG
jgi:AAA domain